MATNDYTLTSSSSSWTSGVPTTTAMTVTFDPNYVTWAEKCQHVTSEELIEYADEVVIAHCVKCNERIQITKVPGGMDLLRLKDLVACLAAGDIETSILLGQFADCKNALIAERTALDEAFDLIHTAERLLKDLDARG